MKLVTKISFLSLKGFLVKQYVYKDTAPEKRHEAQAAYFLT